MMMLVVARMTIVQKLRLYADPKGEAMPAPRWATLFTILKA